MGDLYMHAPRGAQSGSLGAGASGAIDAATLGQAARVLQAPQQSQRTGPLPGELAKYQSPEAGAAQAPNVGPMLATMQHLQTSFGLDPQAAATVTRGLYSSVMSHPELQRWLTVAYPQPQPPGPKTPQQAASQLAQMALLFNQQG